MKALTAMTVMSHQLKCLAKLGLLMRNHRAAVAVIQRKWDEASACFQVKLNTLPSAPHQSSTWSVMVYRASVRVFFEDGMKIVLHLVTLDSNLPQAGFMGAQTLTQHSLGQVLPKIACQTKALKT